MTISLNNPNRFYWFLIAISLFVLWILISPPSCDSKPIIDNNPIKERITQAKIKKDSIHEQVVIKDSIQVKWVTKWRTKTDTLTITEVINLCDSIIYVDSSLIASLKHEVLMADKIIIKQDSVIRNDSIAVLKLSKKLKRSRKVNRALLVVAGALGIVAILK